MVETGGTTKLFTVEKRYIEEVWFVQGGLLLKMDVQTTEVAFRKISVARIKKVRKGWGSVIYALALILIAQIAIHQFVRLSTMYEDRIDYNMFLEDARTVEFVMDEMATKIHSEKLEHYIILIGDSVAWGTNAAAENSLGHYLNALAGQDSQGPRTTVFNLSLPSMHPGDIYTMLLMLKQRGISTDKLMIGQSYAAFSARLPWPRAVFWLGDYLRQLDPEAFQAVLPHLQANNYQYKTGWKHHEAEWMQQVLDIVPIYKYREVIVSYLKRQWKGTTLLGDPRPWYEKDFLESKKTGAQYLSFFRPDPFDMSANNWGIYFMERILNFQKGKETLVFVPGANMELSKAEIEHESYQSNLAMLDHYFADQHVKYINLMGQIPANEFSDHVHLTAEGNQKLAQLLWECWKGEED